MRPALILVALCTFISPVAFTSEAAGQAAVVVPGLATEIILPGMGDRLSTIVSAYQRGAWASMQDTLAAVLCAAKKASKLPGRASCDGDELELNGDAYFVVFLTGSGLLARVPVVTRDEDEGWQPLLPPHDKLYQVVLDGNEWAMKSLYRYSSEADPMIAEIASLLKALNPIAAVLVKRELPDLSLLVAEVPVPIRRGKLKITDEMELSPKDTVANLVKLETEWKVEPATRVALSAFAGAGFSGSGDSHVKVEDGAFAVNDLTSAVTGAGAFFRFAPVQPSAGPQKFPEQLGGFVGGIVTPRPGVMAGLGLDLVPGARLMTGYGVMVVNVPTNGGVGDAPADPEDPFDRGLHGLWLAGLGISF